MRFRLVVDFEADNRLDADFEGDKTYFVGDFEDLAGLFRGEGRFGRW
jgi:hypothetical protein